MNQKVIGSILIVISLIMATFVFLVKAKEDNRIDSYIQEHGSCYLEDGTCLHEDRDWSLYIGGWVLSAAVLALGMYLLIFDKTQKALADQQIQVSSALKEAKEKDEFKAFLSGFTDDEQKVIKSIHEQEGIHQSTLRYRSGLSKTGLSLMLKEFEKKGIITRKQSGKTNELYLRRKF